jgi:hypothetical protein
MSDRDKIVFEGAKLLTDALLRSKAGKEAKAELPYLQTFVDGAKAVGDLYFHDPVAAKQKAEKEEAAQARRRQAIADNARAAMHYASSLEGHWISGDRKLRCEISQPNMGTAEINLLVLDTGENRQRVSGEILIYDASPEARSKSFTEVPVAPPFCFTATMFEAWGAGGRRCPALSMCGRIWPE